MNRLSRRLGMRSLFVALLVVALVALLPMRLALELFGARAGGLSARAVTGSVWSGTLADARFGELSLGDLRAFVAPLPLLVGTVRVDLAGLASNAGKPLHGAVAVAVAGGSTELASMTANVATGRIFAPLPLSRLELEEVSVRFSGGKCAAAAGRVRAILSASLADLALPPSISGSAKCDAGDLLLPMTGQAGTESVDFRVHGDGRYQATLNIQPADAAAAQQLMLAGFVEQGGIYRLSVAGQF